VSCDEAYRVRAAWISSVINNSLLLKREQLVKTMQLVDGRIEEIKRVRGLIERDVKQEYGGIAERLRNAEGSKVAVLMHDMSELQKDVDRLDGILATSSTLMQRPDIKGFLQRWKQLHATVE